MSESKMPKENPYTLEELTSRLEDLTDLVDRQSKVITKTGQQVLEMQVRNVKGRMNEMDAKPATAAETDEFITNDDIVQLVGELQGQLDWLEERSIRRIVNASLNDPDAVLAPMPNKDGMEAPVEIYPKTLKEFIDISDETLIELCSFYELLPPTSAENEALAHFLASGGELAEIAPKVDDFKKEDFDFFFDDVARFIGVTTRRTKGVW